MGKRKHEDYLTPAWCVTRLLEKARLQDARTFLEPAAGEGAIIEACNAYFNHAAEWTGLELREECFCPLSVAVGSLPRVLFGNALEFLPRFPNLTDFRYDAIVTNTPFTLALDFAKACLPVAKRVFFLLRINWLGAGLRTGRYEFVRAHPPDLYMLPDRPSFTGWGTDPVEYAWFHWGGTPAERVAWGLAPDHATIVHLDKTASEVKRAAVQKARKHSATMALVRGLHASHASHASHDPCPF